MITNRLFLLLLLLFCTMASGTSRADYDVSDLQKLFTDKQQREQIDDARSGVKKDADIPQTKKVNISGYVKRSNGKSVVWVNNKNTLDSSRIGDVKVYQSSVGKNKKVTVRVDGKTKSLKPGETWHNETGKIVDSQ